MTATIPEMDGLLAGYSTSRDFRRYGKSTGFIDTRDPMGTDLRHLLESARMMGWSRLFLSGPPPMDYSTGATKAEATRAWAYQPVEDWHEASLGHYLAVTDQPILRYRHGPSGHDVTVLRTATWWGETPADRETSRRAWEGLLTALDAVPVFRGCGLADTPATSGRALWLRTIPEGKQYPVLSDELRALIRETSGQGRIEVTPSTWGGYRRRDLQACQDFTILDGRVMYSALTWGMPVGAPEMWTTREYAALTDSERESTLRGRGRWRVSVKVPAGWAHVGLLPCLGERGTWVYPCTPGEEFTTWVDGSEVWLALQNGWHVEVLEGFTFKEGKPLELWRDKLLDVWRRANASTDPAGKLAARAVRALLLFAIGAFYQGAHPITKTCPVTEPGRVPAGVEVTRVGDLLMWEEPGSLRPWARNMQHPEWSATVWARARVRLLTSPMPNVPGTWGGRSGVGALALDPATVVGFHTDAIYLSGGNPGWPDDGEPGRFRYQGGLTGEFDWPESLADLMGLVGRCKAVA